MSDPPVIFKRSKFKANQRAREGQQPDAQDQRVQSTEAEPSPSAVASKIKTKAKQRVKQKTSLSFGAEEVSPTLCYFSQPSPLLQEGSEDVFKIKKSTLSQKLTLRQHPASPG
jgi:GC-rich sequence DNA-binding factor